MIRSMLAASPLALLIVATAAPSFAADTILPGYWESRNTASALIFEKSSTDKRCITPKEVSNFLTGFSNRHYKCTYPEKTVGDGKAFMVGQCVDKGGTTYNVTLSGEYEATHFHMTAKFSLPGLPLGGKATVDAHLISEQCPH